MRGHRKPSAETTDQWPNSTLVKTAENVGVLVYDDPRFVFFVLPEGDFGGDRLGLEVLRFQCRIPFGVEEVRLPVRGCYSYFFFKCMVNRD